MQNLLNNIQLEQIGTELEEFVNKSQIGEEFAKDAKWHFVARSNGNPIGLITYISVKDSSDSEFPRLVHVIVDEAYRTTGLLGDLFDYSVNLLKEQGFKQLVACVFPGKPRMEKLALKYGFLEFLENEEGKHFYKNI